MTQYQIIEAELNSNRKLRELFLADPGAYLRTRGIEISDVESARLSAEFPKFSQPRQAILGVNAGNPVRQ